MGVREVSNRSPCLALGIFWGRLCPPMTTFLKELWSFVECTGPIREEFHILAWLRTTDWTGRRGEMGDSGSLSPHLYHPAWSAPPV